MLCAGPAFAEHGTKEVEFKNKNCNSFLSDKIDVHIFDTHHSSCSDVWVRGLKKGDTKTVTLKVDGCRYKHEAGGTVLGRRDFDPNSGLSILCYRAESQLACQCEAAVFW